MPAFEHGHTFRDADEKRIQCTRLLRPTDVVADFDGLIKSIHENVSERHEIRWKLYHVISQSKIQEQFVPHQAAASKT